MRRKSLYAALGFALALDPTGVVSLRAATAAEESAETIAGIVTKIDLERGRVTVRSSDESVHEFEATPETLAQLKVGDRLEMQRRPGTGTLEPSER